MMLLNGGSYCPVCAAVIAVAGGAVVAWMAVDIWRRERRQGK